MANVERSAVDAVSSAPQTKVRSGIVDRVAHPINLAVPVVAVAFYLLWRHHLIASISYWAILATLLAAEGTSVVAFGLWGEARVGWRLWALVGADLSAIGAVIYAIGWGPVFAIALILGAADMMRRSGSSVTRPAIVASTVIIGMGQLGVGIGFVPSLIHPPLAHSLAGLEWAGLILTIALLGWFAAGWEKAEEELRHRERHFSALVTNSRDIVIVAGADGVLKYTSPAFESVLGYTSAAAHSLMGDVLLHPDDRTALRAAMAAAALSATSAINEEVRLRRADGEWLWFEAAISNLTDDPDVNGFVADLRDITRRKDAEERLAHAALHDALTGLPNRTLILDRTEQMLSRARRSRQSVAALFIDLDNFKDINDTLGHEAGDKLLRALAQRFEGMLRASDTVGRMGGDEFVVLTESVSEAAGPEMVAERIQDVLREPFHVEGFETVPLIVSASIGIAIGDRPSADELLRDADIALYRAKALGKDRSAVFEPAMQSAVSDRLELEMDLRSALDRDEFLLLYQPVFDLDNVRACGVEALIRWRHPTRGLLAPDLFIPTLEDTGLIIEVGRWVLDEACRQAAAWHGRGHQITMSVNVSMRQLDTDVLVDHVRHALSSSGLAPGSLILEVTETTLMRDTDATVRRLRALKELGVLVAIDDFGTGYSSLAYLRQFPVDALKIDRSFVAAMGESTESVALVHTLVQLGRSLGIETLAEGIEDQWQLERLQGERCELGQGFLFSRPVDPTAVEALFVQVPKHREPTVASER
jgi:diguanylate cyclase (GGDEF)-like protein/PAS domain S-box-containing protein